MWNAYFNQHLQTAATNWLLVNLLAIRQCSGYSWNSSCTTSKATNINQTWVTQSERSACQKLLLKTIFFVLNQFYSFDLDEVLIRTIIKCQSSHCTGCFPGQSSNGVRFSKNRSVSSILQKIKAFSTSFEPWDGTVSKQYSATYGTPSKTLL